MVNKDFVGQDEVDEIIRDFERLTGSRGTLEAHLSEIADRVYPASSGLFFRGAQRTPGEKRNQNVFDSTAAKALSQFAAILDSTLTPRNQLWHKVKASNEKLNKDREVKEYFDIVQKTLFQYRYAPKANFSSNNQKIFHSLGAFGTGSMFIDKLAAAEKGLRYKAVSLSEIYFDENHQGIIDRAWRVFSMSAHNAAQKFGRDVLPEQVKNALTSNPAKKFEFIHCVKPRKDYDPKRVDFKGMEFGSYYISIEGKKLLDEEGFKVFPYAISRYEQCDDEIYGRSPAMSALPAIKTVNEQKKTLLKQGHRAVDPIYLMADDGIMDVFSAKPGTMVSGGVSAEGRELVKALQVGNVNVGKDMMDDERKDINDMFLINLFQVLNENPQQTATEVMERVRERNMLTAPVMGRQQSEYLGTMIEREIDVLSQLGVLPPMPELLREASGEFTIIYDSPLSRSQRAEEASGIMRTMEQAIAYFNATQDPSVFDYLDIDQIMPALAEINGVPPKWMKSAEQVMKIRAGRAQEAEDQKMIQAAPAASAMMKAMPAMQETMGRK